jgi:hypothetical protein
MWEKADAWTGFDPSMPQLSSYMREMDEWPGKRFCRSFISSIRALVEMSRGAVPAQKWE